MKWIRKFTTDRLIMIVIGIAAQILCFFPWLQMREHSYTTIGYLLRLCHSSDMVETMWSDMIDISTRISVKDEDFTLFVYVFAVQLLGWILIQLLCLVHLLLCVRKKPVDVIYVVSLVLSILVCYLHIENSSEWFDSWIVFFYPYIVVFVMLIGFLANKFVDGWKAASEESRELREKDKNENKLPV